MRAKLNDLKLTLDLSYYSEEIVLNELGRAIDNLQSFIDDGDAVKDDYKYLDALKLVYEYYGGGTE